MIRTNGIEIDILRRSISHCGYHKEDIAPKTFALICHLILGFLNKEELLDLIFGWREDGGPMTGQNHIATMMSNSRELFAELQLELKKERGGHYWTRYQLVPKS